MLDGMDEAKIDPAGITHVDLLVAIRLMQKELETMAQTIGKVANSHDQEIKELKQENKTRDREIEDLKIRMGQIIVGTAVLAFIIPIIVTALQPQLRFGSDDSNPALQSR